MVGSLNAAVRPQRASRTRPRHRLNRDHQFPSRGVPRAVGEAAAADRAGSAWPGGWLALVRTNKRRACAACRGEPEPRPHRHQHRPRAEQATVEQRTGHSWASSCPPLPLSCRPDARRDRGPALPAGPQEPSRTVGRSSHRRPKRSAGPRSVDGRGRVCAAGRRGPARRCGSRRRAVRRRPHRQGVRTRAASRRVSVPGSRGRSPPPAQCRTWSAGSSSVTDLTSCFRVVVSSVLSLGSLSWFPAALFPLLRRGLVLRDWCPVVLVAQPFLELPVRQVVGGSAVVVLRSAMRTAGVVVGRVFER